jgi:hypothetical protein
LGLILQIAKKNFKMKNILIGFLFISIICFSQNEPNNSDNKIEINVDKTIFIHQQGDSYFSENEESSFQAKLIPMSYEMLKANMSNASEGILDKGELIIEGIKILYVKKLIDDMNNIILIYLKENDEKSSLSFISFYPKEKENYYKPIIEMAFVSTKIKI